MKSAFEIYCREFIKKFFSFSIKNDEYYSFMKKAEIEFNNFGVYLDYQDRRQVISIEDFPTVDYLGAPLSLIESLPEKIDANFEFSINRQENSVLSKGTFERGVEIMLEYTQNCANNDRAVKVEVIGQELTNIVNLYGLVYKVPARYNWLTIDCLGEMFAFEEKPVLDEEDGRWWCDKEDFRGGRYIGEFYEDTRYYKTLHYIGSGKEKGE